MKILNFGSLNYDHVYQMEHFVLPKETTSSTSYNRNFGGKGLNQSIALAKAGLDVYHAGKVGSDGQDFIDYLKQYNVNTDYLVKDNSDSTGHAIIQVCNGENCIILHGGTNQKIDEKQIDETLKYFEKGDVLLLQNEISNIAYIIKQAHNKGMKIAMNIAPMSDLVFSYPLEDIDIIFVNEIEGAGLVKYDGTSFDEIIARLQKKFPKQEIILTVGKDGAYYVGNKKVLHQDAIKAKVVDTTAAGDTFTGFFLASYLANKDVDKALKFAAVASSITIQGKGAAKSIPTINEVMKHPLISK